MAPTILDRRFYEYGHVICHAGEPVEAIWLILRGKALLKTGDNQNTIFPKSVGSMYGDVEHILGLPYQGNLVVDSPEGLEVVRMSKDKFDAAINDASPFMRVLTQLNAMRVLKSANLTEAQGYLLADARQKLMNLEEKLAEEFFPTDFDPANPPEEKWKVAAE